MNKQQKKDDFSSRDVIFLVYLSILVVIGWVLDVNGIGLSKDFRLAGMMSTLFIGTPIGFYFLYIKKRTNHLQVIEGDKKN